MTLYYVVTDTLATGEGSTICILITRAYPRHDDYEESNSRYNAHYNADGSLHFEMPKLRKGVTPESIALRQFIDEFGAFYVRGAKIISEEVFVDRWRKYVPSYVLKVIDDQHNPNLAAGNVYYASKFHVNYS